MVKLANILTFLITSVPIIRLYQGRYSFWFIEYSQARVFGISWKSYKQQDEPSKEFQRVMIGIENATIAEQTLIGLGRTKCCIVKICYAAPVAKTAHQRLRGHVIHFPRDPGSFVRVLPRPICSLPEFLEVVLVFGDLLPSKLLNFWR